LPSTWGTVVPINFGSAGLATGVIVNYTSVYRTAAISLPITLRSGTATLLKNCVWQAIGPSCVCPGAGYIERNVPFTGAFNCPGVTFTPLTVLGVSLSAAGVFSGTYTSTATANLVFSGVYRNGTQGCNTFSCSYIPINSPSLSCPAPATNANYFVNRGSTWSASIVSTQASSPVVTSYVVSLPGVALASKVMSLTTTGVNNLPLGNTSYTIRMTDTAFFDRTVTCWLFVSSTVNLTCGTYSTGQQSVNLNAQLTGSGSPPLTYATTSALPAGLSLNAATGQITGVVSSSGSTTTGFKVTDLLGLVATKSCTFSAVSAPTMSCNSAARYAIANNGTFSKAIVNCATCVSYTSATLPGSLVLVAGTQQALLTANPVTGPATGVRNILFTGMDANGAVNSVTCPIEIVTAFTVACPTSLTVDVGQRFTSTLATFTGAPGLPTTFTFGPGLPAGVTGNGNDGSIYATVSTGVPQQTAQLYTYTISVVDAAGQFAQSGLCSITVASRLTVTCPSDVTLPSATNYNTNAVIAGGSGSITAAAIVNGVPSGWTSFTAATSGAIAGVPQTSYGGLTQYRVSVTDSNQNTVQSGLCNVTINLPLTGKKDPFH
jgi:hypothetical protein